MIAKTLKDYQALVNANLSAIYRRILMKKFLKKLSKRTFFKIDKNFTDSLRNNSQKSDCFPSTSVRNTKSSNSPITTSSIISLSFSIYKT